MTSGEIDARRAGYEGYEDVGRAAAIERREPGGWLAISGGDVVSFLQGVLTNDVAALATGEHCYAAYLTAQGRMLSDMQVLRREADVLLAVEPEVAGALAERFDKSIFTEDVHVQDLSGTLQTVGIHGPSSYGAVAAIFGDRLAPGIRQALDGGRHVTVPFEGSDVIMFGSSWLGTPGVRIAAAGSQLATIVDRLIGSGVPVLGPAAVAARRIEAGTPVFGIDMTTETIPLEAGIESRAISTTKGCYVGQEIIVRILHRAHGRVARRLVGLELEPGTVPERGTPVEDGGREIGRISSAAWSPLLGRPLALATVQRDFTEAGTVLQAASARATVVPLPVTAGARAPSE